MSHLVLGISIPGVKISAPDEAPMLTNLTAATLDPKRGGNISGRGWKRIQEKKREQKTIIGKKATWAEKEEVREEENAMREFNKNIKEIRQKKIDRIRKQRKEVIERKKLNKEKGQAYQLITNSKSIKKMSKKARKSLQKMPKAMFEEYLHGKKAKTAT